MPANANSGWFSWKLPAGGPTLWTAPGAMSSGGGSSPTPKRAIPGTNASPRSSPICPNVVLHELMKLCSSVPPQVLPPKFESVESVWGRSSAEIDG